MELRNSRKMRTRNSEIAQSEMEGAMDGFAKPVSNANTTRQG